MFLLPSRSPAEIDVRTIPWAHYSATGSSSIPASTWTLPSFHKFEGNTRFHSTEISTGVNVFTVPPGLGGLFTFALSGFWADSNSTQGERYMGLVTTRGNLWNFKIRLVSDNDTMPQHVKGRMLLKEGDVFYAYIHQNSAIAVGISLSAPWGLMLARISPAENLFDQNINPANI